MDTKALSAASPRPGIAPGLDSPLPPIEDGSTAVVAVAPSADAPADSNVPVRDAHGHDPAAYDWVPVLRKARPDGWSPQKQRAFIGALADSGSVRLAAKEVGMTPGGAYALRRSPDGTAFAAAWEAAIQQAAHVLVDQAFERAISGSDEPVFDREGNRIGRKHRQSDALMMFLLRKHFPDRYGDLHRDRPEPQAPRSHAPVADAMPALGPVVPDDPLALMHPDDAGIRIECADLLQGRLASWHRQDGSEERRRDQESADPAFEAELETAKRAADPGGWAAADARQAAGEEELSFGGKGPGPGSRGRSKARRR